jgi:hypothetical protein
MKMKDKLLFLALLLTVLLSAISSNTQAAVNMLIDPSFEIDDDGDSWPDNWGSWNAEWSYGGDGHNIYYAGDPENPARTGDDCVGLYGTDYALWVQDIETGFEIGKTYYHAFYAKDIAEGGSTSTIDPAVEFWNKPRDSGGAKGTTLYFPTNIPNDGQWHLVQSSFVIPEGTGMVAPIPLLSGGGVYGEYLIDDAWFSDVPFSEGTAVNPNPPDGAESVWPDLDELTWTNPEAASPTEPITCNVWFTDDFPEYGKYPGDPNFTNYATQIVDNEAVESVILSEVIPPVDLVMDEVYYWRVDVHDPNISEDPEDVVVGSVWIFDTINRAPIVDAGVKHNLWLEASSVSVTLDATVTDDGLPLSATVTYEWELDSGPAAPTFSPGDAVEDPEVTFDTAGTYVLKLTANDTILNGSDTVTVNVFESTYTGLVAHWKLDEESGPTAVDSVGGHDGDLIGDPTWQSADGQVNGGLLLDGDGDYIEIPDSYKTSGAWADGLVDEITLSIWMKTSDGDFGDDWAGLITKSNEAWRIQRAGGSDTVELVVEGAAYAVSEIGVNDGKWHHVTGVYTGDMGYIYVDGYLEDSAASYGTPGEGSAYIWIGAGLNVGYPDTDFQFKGMLDEARIYEIGLPADKVLAEYIGDGGGTSCGGIYEPMDLNQDCYINIGDMALFIVDWMDCTDIANPDCN